MVQEQSEGKAGALTQPTDGNERPVSCVSFRDPAGALLSIQGRILRRVTRSGLVGLLALQRSEVARRYSESGHLVGTQVLSQDEAEELTRTGVARLMDGEVLLEHEPIWFPSFPYEWPPGMLHAAARLTLDLALAALQEGLGLKDGTPYNVLFRGPEPVFVDVLSFECRRPGDPTWLAYAQFLRTFVLPLLANRALGIGLDRIFLTHREGVEPEELYRWAPVWRRFTPGFLTTVSLPVWLAPQRPLSDLRIYQAQHTSPEKANFILQHLLRGLRRHLDRCAPQTDRRSVWSGYMESHSYGVQGFAAKEAFVREFLSDCQPRTVLDVGCNTGHFGVLAAAAGARVVAIDSDPAVVEVLWRRAAAEHLPLLSLAVDLTRPSPGIGWRNQECPSFLERGRDAFDAVLMLAVLHHMMVTERVPLKAILEVAASLTKRWLVIELVAPEDPMFRRLASGRDELHRGLQPQVFEAACAKSFDIVRWAQVSASRRLYLLSRRHRSTS